MRALKIAAGVIAALILAWSLAASIDKETRAHVDFQVACHAKHGYEWYDARGDYHCEVP